jgi:hypothetical protein
VVSPEKGYVFHNRLTHSLKVAQIARRIALERRCILYIVRRTQLYLDDNLWNALHIRARSQRTTVSHLVREAVRDRYLGSRDEQMKAMKEFVGSHKDSGPSSDAVETVRELRRSIAPVGRFERLERVRKG